MDLVECIRERNKTTQETWKDNCSGTYCRTNTEKGENG